MRKKITISLFVCLNIALMAFADEWLEVYNKVYVKIDKSQNNKIYYWTKMLNDGTLKSVNKQKIDYIMSYNIVDCSQYLSVSLATYEYGLSGKVLSSYVSPYYNYPNIAPFEPVVPQTVGEVINKSVCGLAN